MSTPSQISLPLLAPARGEDETLVPARMVNEWVYCPRLAYLEWVEGEWADTGDTAQGQRVHRRVDTERGNLPAPEEADQEFARASSVTLSSETLGIIAKMDVVETQGDRVVPVDFKKGKRPHVAAGAYEPERVQLCAQGLILEDNGYTVTEGALWFAGVARAGDLVLARVADDYERRPFGRVAPGVVGGQGAAVQRLDRRDRAAERMAGGCVGAVDQTAGRRALPPRSRRRRSASGRPAARCGRGRVPDPGTSDCARRPPRSRGRASSARSASGRPRLRAPGSPCWRGSTP